MNNKITREGSLLLLHSEFTAIIKEQLGSDDLLAAQMARSIVRGMQFKYGAQQIYIPAVDKSDRDAAIRKEFKGTNAGDVCKRHVVSRSSLYRIVKAKPN